MGDRSGGRESKGTSLKKSKKNPGAPAAKSKKAPISKEETILAKLPSPIPSKAEYFDCSIALLSRQFDRDRDKVIFRAQQDGRCCGFLAWFADAEKQTQLADHCKENSGFCYFATGIHPDNIGKTNKKSHEDWISKVQELACRVECIAVLSGINLAKEVGSHFAQESLLTSLVTVASKSILPLVVHCHDAASLDKLCEIYNSLDDELGGEGFSKCPVIVHDIVSSVKNLCDAHKTAISSGFYFIVSAAGIADNSSAEEKENAFTLIRSIPIDRILVCTDSPWKTPQNLPDPYLRTMRNEPANIISVVDALSEALDMAHVVLAPIIRSNTMGAFGLHSLSDVTVPQDYNNESASLDAKTNETLCQQNQEISIHSTDIASSTRGEPDQKIAIDSESEEDKYLCIRCRKQLFASKELTSHNLSVAPKTVFKVGDIGLCTTSLFICFQDEVSFSKRTSLVLHGNAVECAGCNMKVGKFTPPGTEAALCSCGAHIPGPVVKVQATKVDQIRPTDKVLNAKALAERSLLETEQDQEGMLDARSETVAGTKSKKAKKLKSSNKGNFSSYRNKSFIPNASRIADKGNASNVNDVSTMFSSLDMDNNSDEEDSS